MKIRKATKKDFKEIFSMIKEEYLKHYKEKWTEKNSLKTLNYYGMIGKIFVIEIGGEVAGFVILREEYYNNRKSVMVEELVVRGDIQRKGIGRKLMNFVEEYCKNNKVKYIWLITGKKVDAFKFYKELGYKYGEDTAYFSKELR